VFVIDGNFTAVHLRQKNPENDVFLSDGTGYMTSREPYLKHLRAAEAWVEVSPNTPCLYYLMFFSCDAQPANKEPCNHHHADDDNVARRGTDASGLGSLACGRNGFFCPASTVDFQKGEQ
jgi:hypothetical protein